VCCIAQCIPRVPSHPHPPHPPPRYTYKCLGSAVWCLRQLRAGDVAPDGHPPFVGALCDLVREGGDADTNGAVAGALMGCFLCVGLCHACLAFATASVAPPAAIVSGVWAGRCPSQVKEAQLLCPVSLAAALPTCAPTPCHRGYDKLVEQVGPLGWHKVRLAEEMVEPRLARLRTAMGLDA
jgi:hypothetical protein